MAMKSTLGRFATRQNRSADGVRRIAKRAVKEG
jgi:hypothetical protein